MAAIFSLLVVIVLSLIVVRVASVALVLTGLSQQLARFQARSAFTGTGFTTSETEKVVQHPVRRRIIMLLMLLGNAGFIGAMSSLIVGFTSVQDRQTAWLRMGALAAGLTIVWLIARSKWVDRRLSRIIAWALKRYTNLEVRDYAGLLHLGNDYAVVELQVQPGDWIAGRSLAELRLNLEGVLVLGIERADGSYVGAPRGESRPAANDIVLLYGPRDVLQKLDKRRAGMAGLREHIHAVEKQQQLETS